MQTSSSIDGTVDCSEFRRLFGEAQDAKARYDGAGYNRAVNAINAHVSRCPACNPQAEAAIRRQEVVRAQMERDNAPRLPYKDN